MDEAYRLLAVAGPRTLYDATAMWTSFRVNELALLEWRDVDLDGDRPTVRVRAEIAKAKRHNELPLRADLVAMLKQAKPPFATPGDRVFKTVPRPRTLVGGWYRDKKHKRRYLIGDLDRAGIPREDVQGHCVDRHAFKTTLARGWHFMVFQSRRDGSWRVTPPAEEPRHTTPTLGYSTFWLR